MCRLQTPQQRPQLTALFTLEAPGVRERLHLGTRPPSQVGRTKALEPWGVPTWCNYNIRARDAGHQPQAGHSAHCQSAILTCILRLVLLLIQMGNQRLQDGQRLLVQLSGGPASLVSRRRDAPTPYNLISPSSRMARPSGLVPSIALGRALVCHHSSWLLLSPSPWLSTPPARGWWAGLSTIQVLPALSPGPATDLLHISSNSLNLSGPQFPQLQNGVTRRLARGSNKRRVPASGPAHSGCYQPGFSPFTSFQRPCP